MLMASLMACCFQPVHFLMLFTAAGAEHQLRRSGVPWWENDLSQPKHHFSRTATSMRHVHRDVGLVTARTERLVAMAAVARVITATA